MGTNALTMWSLCTGRPKAVDNFLFYVLTSSNPSYSALHFFLQACSDIAKNMYFGDCKCQYGILPYAGHVYQHDVSQWSTHFNTNLGYAKKDGIITHFDCRAGIQ